jgi:hypothetical protein
MRIAALLILALLFHSCIYSQISRKELPATRSAAAIKIDGILDEAAWNEAKPAMNFIEQRPNAGKEEDSTSRTQMFLLYDNTSIYFGGYCREKTRDSISKELIGRDKVGINDFAGVILDTYNDKINALGFFITPYGEQFDIKYSVDNEDINWSAVWDSYARIHKDGWSFEIRIPYSALRFVSKENQTWGLNFVRRRNKTGQQFTWNAVDPKVNGFINQEGQWTGIGKIEAPVRLSFSPYFSSYINYYKPDSKPWAASVNGGMDVKYGISESFTLDMTVVPDFGQVRSDNQVLNLSPFEVKYNENRPFFTEGTELFNKGNLFYSRRVGGTPLKYGNPYNQLAAGEKVVSNPQEGKLINATKISGRTNKGLGIGFFNAITETMYAKIENSTGQTREVETGPLTNYNIAVLDQTLKNNSSVSFINTNVLRNGVDYDANVSAALFNINNKKNTYNWNGKFSISHLTNGSAKGSTGYSHNLGFRKTGGRWNFELLEEIADTKYDINDMGILFTRNYVDHSSLFQPFPNQKQDTKFQRFSTNVNANAQLKNLWWAGVFLGYVPEGNDFYEPRETGLSFKAPQRIQYSGWFETNSAKKFYLSVNYFFGMRKLFNSPNHELSISSRYRFSDKFSLRHSILYNPLTNDAGYSQKYNELNAGGVYELRDVIFSRRDQKTIENVLEANYNFNNKSGITFRARHYWSKVEQKQLYDLNTDGTLSPTKHANISLRPQNFNIFNIDAVYTRQFAPGSFINIVWKSQGLLSNQEIRYSYFKNLHSTVSEPQNNNLSLKIIYYLDYLDIKKLKKDKQQ